MIIDRHLLLQLWDKAVGKPGYDKYAWMQLQEQIEKANRLIQIKSGDMNGHRIYHESR